MYNIPTIDWNVLAPTIVVLVTGIVGLLVEMARPKQNNNAIVGLSLAGLATAFALLLTQLGQPPVETIGGMVFRDQFAVLMQLIIVGVTFLCFLFSDPYLRQRRIAYGEFYPLALWSAAGGMMMVGTNSLLMLFIGLEVLSISLYVLAGMSRDARSEESALKYFLLGSFASAFLLYGIAMVYGASGRIDLGAFADALASGDANSTVLVIFSVALLLVGLGFKTALVPFHQWTPDVYQGAPTNVTAFMAAVSKVAAFGALYRVLDASIDIADIWMPAMVAIAILTMTVGNLVALVQKDVKRALGYSSVAHAGYILVGLIAHLTNPEKVSLAAVVFYLVSYSVMTVGAFAMVSLTAKDGKEGTRTQDLNGMWKKAPLAAGTLFICLVSLVGVPPTAGFFGKWAIFNDALTSGLIVLAIALAINSAISAYYYWQIAKAAFVDDEPALATQFARVGPAIQTTAVITIAGVLLAPLFFGPILQTAQTAGKDELAQSSPTGAIRQRTEAAFATPRQSPPQNPAPTTIALPDQDDAGIASAINTPTTEPIQPTNPQPTNPQPTNPQPTNPQESTRVRPPTNPGQD